jgi:hypothetical protein
MVYCYTQRAFETYEVYEHAASLFQGMEGMDAKRRLS